MAALGIPFAAAAAGIVGAAYLDAKHFIASDLNKGVALSKAGRQLRASDKADKNSVYYIFENQVKKQPKKEAYLCEGVSKSYEQVSLGQSPFPAPPQPPLCWTDAVMASPPT